MRNNYDTSHNHSHKNAITPAKSVLSFDMSLAQNLWKSVSDAGYDDLQLTKAGNARAYGSQAGKGVGQPFPVVSPEAPQSFCTSNVLVGGYDLSSFLSCQK